MTRLSQAKYDGVKLLCCLLFLILAQACGKSPLLNHRDEANLNGANGTTLVNSAPCALRWSLDRVSPVCATVVWEQGPVVGENSLHLELSQDVSLYSIDVWAFMPDMGHGTAPVVVTRLSGSSIQVSELFLIMGGRWVLHFVLNGIDQTVTVQL